MSLQSTPPIMIISNKYLLYELIGKGGTAKIYKGVIQNDKSNKQFAFKIVKPKSQNLQVQNYECKALSLLQHDSICKLYGFGEGEAFKVKTQTKKSVSYLILEYIPNGELFDYIYYPKIGFGENEITKYLFLKIIDTVEYIHENNFCHRDLKTENIMIDEDFNIKLCDFGFAKQNQNNSPFVNLCEGDSNDNGLFSSFLGTKGYMSPEIVHMKNYYGTSNDIFSLGVMLFILVTGLKPFVEANPNDTFYCYINQNNYEDFWKNRNVNVSDEFKILFQLLISADYSTRPSISEIKRSQWMSSVVKNENLSKCESELKKELERRFSIVTRKKNLMKQSIMRNAFNPFMKKRPIFTVTKQFYATKKIGKSIFINKDINVHVLYKKIVEFLKNSKISLNMVDSKKYTCTYIYAMEFFLDDETKVAVFVKNDITTNNVNCIDFIKCYGNDCICGDCYDKFVHEFIPSLVV